SNERSVQMNDPQPEKSNPPPLHSWERLEQEAMFKRFVSEILEIPAKVIRDHKNKNESGSTFFVHRANRKMIQQWSSQCKDAFDQLRRRLVERSENFFFGSEGRPKFDRWERLQLDVFDEFRPFILKQLKRRNIHQDGFSPDTIARGFSLGLMFFIVEQCDRWCSTAGIREKATWQGLIQVYQEEIQREIDKCWRNVKKSFRSMEPTFIRGSGGRDQPVDGSDKAKQDKPWENAYFNERKAKLYGAIDQLPAQQKEAVLLHDIEELNYEQTAERMNISRGKAWRLVKLGRQEIKRLLDGRLDNGPSH
ncbi:MAG: RNA polymerase sigma factor, partial [Pirellula sp.]